MQKVMCSCADADLLMPRGAVLPWQAAGPVAVRQDPCGLLAASPSAPQLLPSCPMLLLVAAAVAPLLHGCCPKGQEMWCVQHLLAHSGPTEGLVFLLSSWCCSSPSFLETVSRTQAVIALNCF